MTLPEHINWLEWRIVRAGYARLTELRESWTLLDVLDAHTILDAEEDLHARTS